MGRKKSCCPRCGIDGVLQKRVFSDQALAALVVWQELESTLIDDPLCHECYVELRDILIERSEELGNISELDIRRLPNVG